MATGSRIEGTWAKGLAFLLQLLAWGTQVNHHRN